MTNIESTEHDLIQRIRRDDDRALDELVCLYGESLAKIAYTIVGSVDLAQDVTQEVFCALWDRRASLEVRGNIAAYLAGATRNRALNLARRESAQRVREAKAAEDEVVVDAAIGIDVRERDPDAATNTVATPELSARVQAALDTLPPRTKQVLLMYANLDLEYKEIASILNVSVSTVRTQISRATRILVRQLGGWKEVARREVE